MSRTNNEEQWMIHTSRAERLVVEVNIWVGSAREQIMKTDVIVNKSDRGVYKR